MSELLNSGNIGKTVFANLAAQRKAIVENWGKSGLHDGLKGQVRENIAQMYEGQASAMLNAVFETHKDKAEYHRGRYASEMKKNSYRGARFHLTKMIHSLEDNIYDKYCT